MNEIAKPSVQSLFIEMRFNGQSLSTGTGFLVNSARGILLVTNRHNVTGRRQDDNKPMSPTGGVPNELAIYHNVKGTLGAWVQKIEPLYDNQDRPLWYEHPDLRAKMDVVALPLTHTDQVEFYPYDLENLGPNLMVGPTEVISVIGFPFGITAGGYFPVWATGFIASEPVVDFGGLPVLLIDCRSRQGQSGSPVLAYRSGGSIAMDNGMTGIFAGPVIRFIGIYSGRINAESDLGIVWKSKAILELTRSVGL